MHFSQIKKPSIPLVFLDTHFYIDLHKCHRGLAPIDGYCDKRKELYDLIYSLTKGQKILCPRADQFNEFGLRDDAEDIFRLQGNLSFGVRTMTNDTAFNQQVFVAMKSYIEDNEPSSIIYDHNSLFTKNPSVQLKESTEDDYLVDIYSPLSDQLQNDFREHRESLSKDFEALRAERDGQPRDFKTFFNEERQSYADVLQKFIKGGADMPHLFMEWLAVLKRYGEKDASFLDLYTFLQSPHFQTVPYMNVLSCLYASMRIQPNKIKKTDNFDFQQASHLLPFSSYFLTDNPLAHRLKAGPLYLDKCCNTKVYQLSEINNFLEDLSFIDTKTGS